MRKVITPYLQTSSTKKNHRLADIQVSPSDEIVNKILQFAATFRVEKVPENEFVNYCLN